MYILNNLVNILSFIIVLITPNGEGSGLRASYKLNEPVTEFSFEQNNLQQRKSFWSTDGDDWVFDGSTIRRVDDAAFSKFDIMISPDSRSIPRHYVVASPIGNRGWALLQSAFNGLDQKATLKFENFESGVAIHPSDLPTHDSKTENNNFHGESVIYIGPVENIRKGSVQVIAGPEVPDWVVSSVQLSSKKMISKLRERLKKSTDSAPTIIISYNPIKKEVNRKGGALDGATIVVNLWSDMATERLKQKESLEKFIAHEIVHLWFSEIWNSSESASNIWLHEGIAEYLAARIYLSRDQFQDVAATHLERCFKNIGAQPLDGSMGVVSGDVAYDCGFAMQLSAELAATSRRKGDILSLWFAILTSSSSGTYGSEDFFAEAKKRGGKKFSNFSDPLFQLQGHPKNIKMGNALLKLGVSIEGGPPSDAHGTLLLRPAFLKILDSMCTGRRGWYSNKDHFEMVTGDRCGSVLAGDPKLSTINGYSVTDEPFKAYIAIRDACGSKSPLEIGRLDGQILGLIDCQADIDEPDGIASFKIPELPNLDYKKTWYNSFFR